MDNEPWGFAPFHYGRWCQYGGRWAWVPGGGNEPRGRRPVYAPALVAFLGEGGVAVDLSFGGRPQSWIPLGTREAYAPAFRHSEAYGHRIAEPGFAVLRSSDEFSNRAISVGGGGDFFRDRRSSPSPSPSPSPSVMRGREDVRSYGRLGDALPDRGRPPVELQSQPQIQQRRQQQKYSLPFQPPQRAAPRAAQPQPQQLRALPPASGLQ